MWTTQSTVVSSLKRGATMSAGSTLTHESQGEKILMQLNISEETDD